MRPGNDNMVAKRTTRTGEPRAQHRLEPPIKSAKKLLRLVDPSLTADPAFDHLPTMGDPITGPTDPRWVLAVRTAEQMQGYILTPERRERLIQTGKLMGLTIFDANLVIAIVQDQARRDYQPDYCPTAGEPQLTLVPLPRRFATSSIWQGRRALTTAALIVTILALELLALKMLFF